MIRWMAVVVALACGGCWRDKPAAAPPEPAPTKPVAAKAVVAPKPPPPDVPPECVEYMAAVEELAKCPTLPPATREALLESVKQSAAVWGTATAEEKASLVVACTTATDAVRQSTAACGP